MRGEKGRGGKGWRERGEGKREGGRKGRRKGRERERDLAPQKKNPGAATDHHHHVNLIRRQLTMFTGANNVISYQ